MRGHNDNQPDDPAEPDGPRPSRLKAAMRRARVEFAERTAVVLDLRDAELARLEVLNEALTPLFDDIPAEIDLFDRGISQGDTPRLWIDSVAHIVMGRDKRLYRFVQDTLYGRKVLAESLQVDDIVTAVTDYVARRMVERDRALASGGPAWPEVSWPYWLSWQRWRSAIWPFAIGVIVGVGVLFLIAAIIVARQSL